MLLCNILEDVHYRKAEDDRHWMPLPAVKLLGTLADPRVLPQLVNELKQKPLQIIFPKPVRKLRAK
ncbi:MAG: hypothetical protein MIO93_16365, partial [ANME-2 cluster archaeon]|nr:hypothetical protein [ANME-2 cluster archaeon]